MSIEDYNRRRRFERLRTEMGMTQSALAKELGLQPNTISRYELGTIPIPERTMKLMELLRRQVGLVNTLGIPVTRRGRPRTKKTRKRASKPANA